MSFTAGPAAVLDVDYRGDHAVAAALLVASLKSPVDAVLVERAVRVSPIVAYEPGSFYKRELPCLLAVLTALRDVALAAPLGVIVIDGYVWLSRTKPGLGARLHAALGETVPIVGVAKTAFHGNDAAREVRRGPGARPLFVTAMGCDLDAAAEAIRQLPGAFRVPTWLTRADRLCRDSPSI